MRISENPWKTRPCQAGLWQGIRIDSNNEDPLPQAPRGGLWQGILINSNNVDPLPQALSGGLWQGIRINSNNADPLPQALLGGLWQGIRILSIGLRFLRGLRVYRKMFQNLDKKRIWQYSAENAPNVYVFYTLDNTFGAG